MGSGPWAEGLRARQKLSQDNLIAREKLHQKEYLSVAGSSFSSPRKETGPLGWGEALALS